MRKGDINSSASRRERAEGTEGVRQKLLDAATAIVGKYGYADATIARITKEAGVASGTFYLYFSNQQTLFDQLLPEMGSRLLDYIRDNTGAESTSLKYEEQRINAYFDFCRLNPGFLRIYHEAAIFAPKAYRKHFERLADGYRRAIQHSREVGELPLFQEDEVEGLVHMLMGARSYLSMLHASGRKSPPASKLISIYMKVIEKGVFGDCKNLGATSTDEEEVIVPTH